MVEPVRCVERTRGGRACRAWAVRGSVARVGRALCVAHGGSVGLEGAGWRAGCPRSGEDGGMVVPEAVGLYEPFFRDGELAALEAVYDVTSLRGEVAVARVVARRLLGYLDGMEGVGAAELGRVVPLLLQALGLVGELVQMEKEMAGDEEEDGLEPIRRAFDELADEWGIGR
jgi:hypothetical protein